ncbi:MAG: Holliday junction resolvasome RuvABC endonuclease subunit [Saprospiraceae bacterium]|jgi:Holliday junction resolvasome RuvABC endonuclease subunit
MKKLIFVLLAGSVAFTSCNKETSLGNKLKDKWDLASQDDVSTTVVQYYSATGALDSTKTNPYDNINVKVTKATTGTLDFVSDDNIVLETKTVTTTATTSVIAGVTSTVSTVTESEDKMAYEYFATGEEEVTLIVGGSYTVYKVLTNEKDAQVWESTDVNVSEDVYGNGSIEKLTTTTTVSTLTMNKQED